MTTGTVTFNLHPNDLHQTTAKTLSENTHTKDGDEGGTYVVLGGRERLEGWKVGEEDGVEAAVAAVHGVGLWDGTRFHHVEFERIDTGQEVRDKYGTTRHHLSFAVVDRSANQHAGPSMSEYLSCHEPHRTRSPLVIVEPWPSHHER
eukprot:CCRYP_016609-RC/>CCRYP_016609-RC protein AED:0.48 eAED:1.00 QI:0/0/0/1/0/0/4/0/146